MKKFLLKTALGLALVFSLHAGASAQLSVNLNIGSQPAWGPTGYNHVDYYYLPDIESYYDVATGQYIYQSGGRWVFANTLPPRYRGYDLYSGYKVVVNRPKPYLNFSRDRVAYGRYKNWSGARQPMLRESRNNGNQYGNNGNRPGNGNMNRPGNNGNHYGNDNTNRTGNNGNHYGNDNRNQGGMQNQGQRQPNNQQGQNRYQGQGNQNQNQQQHGDDRGREGRPQ